MAQTDIIFVNDNPPPGGNGSGINWANAEDNLTDALADAHDRIVLGQAQTVQVWVAEGRYKPSAEPQTLPPDIAGDSRSWTFEVHRNVELYGGFDTTEDQFTDPETGRQGGFELTILSGDIGVVDDRSDNSFSVVRVGDFSVSTMEDSRLDGFRIEDGNALQSSMTVGSRGGGLRVWNADGLVVANCTFTQCAARRGGGAFLSDTDFDMKYCFFESNTAILEGGGAYVADTTAPSDVHNCSFDLNEAGIPDAGTDQSQLEQMQGGGLYVEDVDERLTVANCLVFSNAAGLGAGAYVGTNGSGSDPGTTFVNCTFTKNLARHVCAFNIQTGLWSCTLEGRGDAFYYLEGGPSHEIHNTIVWGNLSGQNVLESVVVETGGLPPTIEYSDVETAMVVWPGLGNLNTDPLFESPSADNFELSQGSPCRDAGNNGLLPADATDLDFDDDLGEDIPYEFQQGDVRVFSLPSPPTVEMGAHEFVPDVPIE